jgi:hypothetical protein
MLKNSSAPYENIQKNIFERQFSTLFNFLQIIFFPCMFLKQNKILKNCAKTRILQFAIIQIRSTLSSMERNVYKG